MVLITKLPGGVQVFGCASFRCPACKCEFSATRESIHLTKDKMYGTCPYCYKKIGVEYPESSKSETQTKAD